MLIMQKCCYQRKDKPFACTEYVLDSQIISWATDKYWTVRFFGLSGQIEIVCLINFLFAAFANEKLLMRLHLNVCPYWEE